MNRVTVDSGYRDMVPESIRLPCEHSDAVIEVSLAIEADPVRVVAPGLSDILSVLPAGSAGLVKHYCDMWTRYLAQCGHRDAAVDDGPVQVVVPGMSDILSVLPPGSTAGQPG